MSYVYMYVASVALTQEVARSASQETAAEAMIAHCKKLIAEGADPDIRLGSWVAAYLVPEDQLEVALSGGKSLDCYRQVGLRWYESFFPHSGKQAERTEETKCANFA